MIDPTLQDAEYWNERDRLARRSERAGRRADAVLVALACAAWFLASYAIIGGVMNMASAAADVPAMQARIAQLEARVTSLENQE